VQYRRQRAVNRYYHDVQQQEFGTSCETYPAALHDVELEARSCVAPGWCNDVLSKYGKRGHAGGFLECELMSPRATYGSFSRSGAETAFCNPSAELIARAAAAPYLSLPARL
jgi:hypothetical protein